MSQLMPVVAPDRTAMREVIRRFPVRISQHLLSRIGSSQAISAQFLPDAREVTTLSGQVRCFSGLLATGIHGLERMYIDRVILMPHHACPAYCRFCFRKFYEHGQGSAMTRQQMDQALNYIGERQEIVEVLITGGEPVMDRKRLAYLLEGLRRIDHVATIRIACRSLVLAPELIDAELIALLRAHQDLRAGRPLEVASHTNHADELSGATIDRVVALREAGLHVYNQAVLLRGVNCDVATLEGLLRALRRVGVECYYLFFAGPVQGMQHQRPTLAEAMALKRALRERVSGRANPAFIVTTRLGKVELGVDGHIVKREQDGRHVWISTPYRLETFRRVSADFHLPADARVAEDGAIEIRYLDGTPQMSSAGESSR